MQPSSVQTPAPGAQQQSPASLIAPTPGEHWPEQGGLFVGTMPARDGRPAYHLILSDAAQGETPRMAWGPYERIEGADSYYDGAANTAAMAAAGLALGKHVAALQIEGHADWYIPSQAEAHMLAAVAKEQFKPTWYWTSTQYSEGNAWLQYFVNGGQLSSLKKFEGRCRAVRRSFIQSFNPS